MGFILALISSFAYALDTTLMAQPYRHMNIFAALGLRGAAIGLTGLVLLLFVPLSVYASLPEYLPALLLAGLSASFANWGYAKSTHYFPVGIANACVLSLQVLVTGLLGYMFFQERLSPYTILLMSAILALSIYASSGKHISNFQFKKPYGAGVLFLLINGVFQSLAFFLLTKTSRALDPLLAAYVWEVGIGAFCLLAAFVTLKNEWKASLRSGHFKTILWRSFPTVPAVACYAVATTLAPLAIVQALFSAVALFAAMLGNALYGEPLQERQIAALVLLIALVALLKYSL